MGQRKVRSEVMSLDDAEAEFTRLCKEISRLENRLSAARKRAEKLAQYIEIAREKEGPRKTEPTETTTGQATVVRLQRRRRTQE